MKIFIELNQSGKKDDYMEFDTDTMYCKTRNNGIVNYDKFTNHHLGTILTEFGKQFLKKGN